MGVPSEQLLVLSVLLKALLMRLAAVLPQNIWAFVAIAAAPSIVLYLLIERQFARAEIAGAMLAIRNPAGYGADGQ